MRILHTADWHLGRRLGRFDRDDDFRAALDQVVEHAHATRADVVLVAGDLLESARPTVEALRLMLETLERLAEGGRQVVAIAGNHDPPAMFELLAPLLRSRRIHLVGEVKRPDDGGIVDLEIGDERLAVGCLPFLREGRVVDFTSASGRWHGAYADRLRRVAEAYSKALVSRGPDVIKVLMAHFLIDGVLLGRGDAAGQPRGERPLHLGQAWAATHQAIPAGPHYVALGHIHAPQTAPNSPIPAEYAGSLLELDFGEAGEAKRVILVEATPGKPVHLETLPIRAGRPLRRVIGSWAAIQAQREALADVWLDLVVKTNGPEPGLADRARELFPFLVKVRADYGRIAPATAPQAGRSWDDLWSEWRVGEGRPRPSPGEVAAFRELLEEVRE
jgi:exonuclease SbcD